MVVQAMNAASSADCSSGQTLTNTPKGCSSAASEKGNTAQLPGACTTGAHLFSAIQQQYAAAAAAAIAANANAHQYQASSPYAQQQSVSDNAMAAAASTAAVTDVTGSELVGKKRSAETDIFQQLVFSSQHTWYDFYLFVHY